MTDPNLERLRGYDVILRLADSERPRGIRSPLNQSRKLPVVTDQAIADAVAVMIAVANIQPECVQRAIVLSMAFSDGAPEYSRAQIARELGCSEKSVTRFIQRGIAILEPVLIGQQLES